MSVLLSMRDFGSTRTRLQRKCPGSNSTRTAKTRTRRYSDVQQGEPMADRDLDL